MHWNVELDPGKDAVPEMICPGPKSTAGSSESSGASCRYVVVHRAYAGMTGSECCRWGASQIAKAAWFPYLNFEGEEAESRRLTLKLGVGRPRVAECAEIPDGTSRADTTCGVFISRSGNDSTSRFQFHDNIVTVTLQEQLIEQISATQRNSSATLHTASSIPFTRSRLIWIFGTPGICPVVRRNLVSIRSSVHSLCKRTGNILDRWYKQTRPNNNQQIRLRYILRELSVERAWYWFMEEGDIRLTKYEGTSVACSLIGLRRHTLYTPPTFPPFLFLLDRAASRAEHLAHRGTCFFMTVSRKVAVSTRCLHDMHVDVAKDPEWRVGRQ